MKRVLPLLLLCLALLVCGGFGPMFCQQIEPPPDPVWMHSDEEIIIDAKIVRDDLTDAWGTDTTAAWAHFVTDNTEVGPLISYARDTATGDTGAGAGMLYEFNLPMLRLGHFFLGGDAQYLMSDAGDLAPILAATRIGYKLHVGESAAVRISLDLKRPVNPDDPEARDRLSSLGLAIGISFGVTPSTEVR